MIIDIVPVTTSITYTKVDVTFLPNKFAPPYTAMVVFTGETSTDPDQQLPTKIKYVDIPEEVYEEWGTDDAYMIDYIINECGLQKQE